MARDISVRLDLDTGRFTSRMRGATGDLERFKGQVERSSKSVQSAERHTRQWGRGLRDLVITVGLARHALVNLNDMILGLPRSIIKANAELERMKMLMVGLGGSTDGWQEANAEAEQSVKDIYDMAKRAPFEVGALTDSFVKLKAAGVDPASGSLQALVDSVAKFGGTSEQLKRASIAIQQMAGKGVISMEELRQQLGEAVPNAMQIMARALNMEIGDMVDVISTGTLEASSALEAMFRQMALENGGSALKMTDTFEGLTQRMKTRWIELQKIVGEAGFFDNAKRELTEFVDVFMASREAQAFAQDVGQAMASVVTAVADGVKFVIEYRDEIKNLLIAMAAWKAGSLVMATGILPKLATGLRTVAAVMRAELVAAMVAGAVNMGKFTVAGTAASLMAGGLRGVLIALGLAARTAAKGLLALAGPIGVAVAIGWTLYEAWDALVGKGEELKALDEIELSFLSEEELQKNRDMLPILEKQISEQKKLYNVLRQRADRTGNVEQAKIAARALQELSDLELEYEARKEALRRASLEDAKREADARFRIVRLGIEKEFSAKRVAYENDLEALRQRILAEEGLTAQQRQDKITEERVGIDNDFIDAQVEMYSKLKEEYVAAMNDSANSAEVQAMAAEMVARTREQIESLEKLRGTGQGATIIGGDDAATLRGAAKWAQNLEVAYAKLGAKADGTGEKVAELNAKVKAGLFTDEEAIANARTLAEAYDERKAKIDALKEAATKYEQFQKRIIKLDGIAAKLEERTATTNPWLRKSAEVKQYTTELENMKAELDALLAKMIAAGAESGDVEAVQAQIDGLDGMMERFRSAGEDLSLSQMQKDAIKFSEDLLTEQDRITAQYERMKMEAFEWLNAQDSLTAAQVLNFQTYYDALDKMQARMEETPVQKMFREWEDSGIRFQQVWADAIDGFSSELASALVKGEADFQSFAESIVEMIIKIQMQKMIAGLVTGFLPGFGSAATQPEFGYGGAFDGSFANGGIMSSAGVMPLEKYAMGGIATRPQVALFGEGDMAEAYVPLPDGRSIPAVIKDNRKNEGGGAPTVNVINQGQPAEVSDVKQRFDGEAYVIDVVMRAASKPGPLRETIKGGR